MDPLCEPRSGERGLAAALVSPAAACAWETGLGPRRVGRGGQETLQRPFSVSSTHEGLSARVCSDPAPAKPRKPCETAPRPSPPCAMRAPLRLLRTPARGAVSGGERSCVFHRPSPLAASAHEDQPPLTRGPCGPGPTTEPGASSGPQAGGPRVLPGQVRKWARGVSELQGSKGCAETDLRARIGHTSSFVFFFFFPSFSGPSPDGKPGCEAGVGSRGAKREARGANHEARSAKREA